MSEGYRMEDLEPCIRWMTVFVDALDDQCPSVLRRFENVNEEDQHNIQTHVVSIGLLVSHCTMM